MSRRELLNKAGAGAAAAIGMGANILPVHAEPVVRKKRVGANDKVVLGLIGCGGMRRSGHAHSDAQAGGCGCGAL